MTALQSDPSSQAPAMVHDQLEVEGVPVLVKASRFSSPAGPEEIHFMMEPTRYASMSVQLSWLEEAYRQALKACNTSRATAILRRLFCSDLMNQVALLSATALAAQGGADEACAVSLAGQPPVGPAKVALWAYHLVDRTSLIKQALGSTLHLQRGALRHQFTTGLTAPDLAGAHAQTHALLQSYGKLLADFGLTLADHVMRTWFYVRDIDVNYAGLVASRRDWFAQHGLTAQTHYIASSGIGGCGTDPRALVTLDAYAIQNLKAEQVRYLKARDHLSPTAIYGVTFERATEVDYRDRRHFFISGTASIDAQGRIVHPGDVERQLERTLENIQALLAEGGATIADMNSWIVYLRDASDGPRVAQLLQSRIGQAPMVMVAAPVCRPGWLVEIEGMATLPIHRPELPAY